MHGQFDGMIFDLVEAVIDEKTKRYLTTAEIQVTDTEKNIKKVTITVVVEPTVFGETVYPPADWEVMSSVWAQLKQMEADNGPVQ